MRKITIDILKLNDLKHTYLKDVFNFPDYYGHNLDAFYDLVSSMYYTDIYILNFDQANTFSLKVINILNDISLEYKNLLLFK